ncbi:MAG TPA: hypothetical protein VLG36_00375 [Candidatus Chromulinivoraceae bacterium]|nr:hypothetical protein [Candidatus Chromulinivoraceae bacterium]
MANLESLNSFLIGQKISQSERLDTLAKESIRQYESLIKLDDAENDQNNKAIE